MSDLVINGALITLLLAVIGGSVKLTFALTRVEKELKASQDVNSKDMAKQLADQEKAHQDKLVRLEHDHQEELAAMRREFGETVNAIRQKVHDFETWSRDEFVRKQSFEVVIGRMEKGIEVLGEKIEKRLDKMAERMEKIAGN